MGPVMRPLEPLCGPQTQPRDVGTTCIRPHGIFFICLSAISNSFSSHATDIYSKLLFVFQFLSDARLSLASGPGAFVYATPYAWNTFLDRFLVLRSWLNITSSKVFFRAPQKQLPFPYSKSQAPLFIFFMALSLAW